MKSCAPLQIDVIRQHRMSKIHETSNCVYKKIRLIGIYLKAWPRFERGTLRLQAQNFNALSIFLNGSLRSRILFFLVPVSFVNKSKRLGHNIYNTLYVQSSFQN